MGSRWLPRIATPSGSSGGSGPAPPNQSVQFNNGGLFGGDATFLFDNGSKTVTEPNIIVNDAISETNVISPAQIVATQNDFAPAGFATAVVLRLSTDAMRMITGLAGGTAGRRVVILNIGTQPILLGNENTSSAAANRFSIGADSAIQPGGAAILWYDTASSRWRTWAMQQVKTVGTCDFYVAGDAAGATDTGPGTIAVPWKTLNHAIDVLNQFDEVTGQFTVHVAPAPVAGYTLTSVIKEHLLRANVVFIADGAGQGGDGFNQLLAATSAIAGSSATQIVTGGGLGVNTFRGKTVIVLTGAAAGDRRTIRDHTDTTIIPDRNFSAAVANNDTFRIVEPATIVPILGGGTQTLCQRIGVGLAGAAYTGNPNPPAVPSLMFINFQLQAAGANPLRIAGSSVVFYGCELYSTVSATIGFSAVGDGTAVLAGCEYPGGNCNADVGTSLGAPSVTSWSGWGMYGKTGLTWNTQTLGGFFVTGITSNIATMSFSGETLLWVGGSSSIANGLTALQIGLLGLTMRVIIGSIAGIAPQVALANTTGTNAAIEVATGGNTNVAVDIYLRRAVLSAPVLVRPSGNQRWTIGSSANASGSGTTAGIDVRNGAKVVLEGVTGLLGPGGNDLSVDSLASFIAAGDLSAAGQAYSNQITVSTIARLT